MRKPNQEGMPKQTIQELLMPISPDTARVIEALKRGQRSEIMPMPPTAKTLANPKH